MVPFCLAIWMLFSYVFWHAIHNTVQKLHPTIGILVITQSHQWVREPFLLSTESSIYSRSII